MQSLISRTHLVELERDDDAQEHDHPAWAVAQEKLLCPTFAWIFSEPHAVSECCSHIQPFNGKLHIGLHVLDLHSTPSTSLKASIHDSLDDRHNNESKESELLHPLWAMLGAKWMDQPAVSAGPRAAISLGVSCRCIRLPTRHTANYSKLQCCGLG